MWKVFLYRCFILFLYFNANIVLLMPRSHLQIENRGGSMEYSPNARNKEKNTFAKDFILPLVETVEMQDFPFRGFGQSAKTYCLLGTYYFL